MEGLPLAVRQENENEARCILCNTLSTSVMVCQVSGGGGSVGVTKSTTRNLPILLLLLSNILSNLLERENAVRPN